MGYEDQVRRDLARADGFAALDWLARINWLMNHPDDEFGYFYFMVDHVAVRYAGRDLGTSRKRVTMEDIFNRFKNERRARRKRDGRLQGLRDTGRGDQAPGTVSGTTVRHASPARRQGPSRTHA